MEHQKQTWTLTPDQVLEALDTSLQTGLSEAEAARRLAEHGPNELIERGGSGPTRQT
jgi:magnesium-transporting ATPase (P-type)